MSKTGQGSRTSGMPSPQKMSSPEGMPSPQKMLSTEQQLLLAVKQKEVGAEAGLADYYEEVGNIQKAAKYRKQAGLSLLRYVVVRKQDQKKVAEYPTLGAAAAYINDIHRKDVRRRRYGRDRGERVWTDEGSGKRVPTQSIERATARDFEIHLCELRYVDLGVVRSPSIEQREMVVQREEKLYLRDVCLTDLLVKHGKPGYWIKAEDPFQQAAREAGLTTREVRIAVRYIYDYGMEG